MENTRSNFNSLYRHIIANSLFTEKQISIISKRVTSQYKAGNISSGAYYRQVKQCRLKLMGLLYSIILLRCIGAIDEQTLFTIEKLANHLTVILDLVNSDIPEGQSMQTVIYVIQQLFKRMCKV
jgi:sugar phosphate permease